MEHKFFVNNTEFTVELVESDYEGPLNRIYAFVFHISESENNKRKAIRIVITDETIDMWQGYGGNKQILEDKDIFAWQLVPYLLPQLLTKNAITVVIYATDTIQKEEGKIYIRAKNTISETARSVIFADGKPTNNLIRREILKVCFNAWQQNPHSYVNRVELLKYIPISEVELERNLDYLVQSYYIDGKLTTGGYMLVKIRTEGINVFENPVEFESTFRLSPEQQTINVGGDMITTVTIGNGNQNTVKNTIVDTSPNPQTK